MLRDSWAIVDTGTRPGRLRHRQRARRPDTAAIVALAISPSSPVPARSAAHPLTNAIGGVLGTGLAVFIALRTGSAVGLLRAAGAAERRRSRSCSRARCWSGARCRLPRRRRSTNPRRAGASDPRVRRVVRRGVARLGRRCSRCAPTVYAVLIAAGKAGCAGRRCRSSMGWPAFLGAALVHATATCRTGSAARRARPAHDGRPADTFSVPVRVRRVAAQRRRASSRSGSASTGAHAHGQPVGGEHASARSAIATWPNAVGCTWSAITRLRAPKPRRSTTSAPRSRADASIAALASRPRAGARAPEVERDGQRQQPIAALGEERERGARGRARTRRGPSRARGRR